MHEAVEEEHTSDAQENYESHARSGLPVYFGDEIGRSHIDGHTRR
jgi:hypothetical protein